MITDRENPISNSKLLLTIVVGSTAGWSVVFLVVGFPIFHLVFKVPIATIASYLGTCCAVQVAISPWLIYARKIPQRPEGRVTHLVIAVTVFVTTISMLFFYYIRRGLPEDPDARQFTSIGMGGTVLLAMCYLAIKLFVSRRRKDSTSVISHHEELH